MRGISFDDANDPLAVGLQQRLAAEGFDTVLTEESSAFQVENLIGQRLR